MRCKCGNEIENVPEHLKDLVEWVCQKCTNTSPKSQPLPFDAEPISRRVGPRRNKNEEQGEAEADAA